MDDRMKLQDELQSIMGDSMVCYQPPESVKLSYPCVVYMLDNVVAYHADDRAYRRTNRYSVTLMTKNPVPDELEQLLDLQGASFDRHFVSDNIHHFALNIQRTRLVEEN